LLAVNPGHAAKFPFSMACMSVDLTGEKADSWRYQSING
jgi:hypothetical protein